MPASRGCRVVALGVALCALCVRLQCAPLTAWAQPTEKRRLETLPPGYTPPEPTAGALHWQSVRVASSPDATLGHCEVILLSLKFQGRWGGNACSGRRRDANFLVLLTPQEWRRDNRPVIAGSNALVITSSSDLARARKVASDIAEQLTRRAGSVPCEYYDPVCFDR